jgi:hypothetical protein
VRFLIGRGWSYPTLAETLKGVYVAEAVTHYTPEEGELTDSRISLLTGIHRKDVKRLRALMEKKSDLPALRHGAGLAARVVAAWVSTPRFLDSRRRPKPLPVSHTRGRASFEDLVKVAKADMRPNVILDELLRVGVAQMDDDGRVRLLRNAYIPDTPRDKVAYLGDNITDHLQSALHNVSGADPTFLERAVYYELIDPQALEQLRPELVRMAEEFLQNVNGKLLPLNRAAIDEDQLGEQGRRMRLGLFYFEDATRYRKPARRGAKRTKKE